MHFVIANVPEGFRSPDLRNFFSEFIEKEAFNCFHFRHRPQTNLLNILKNSSHVLPHDKVTRSEVSCTLSGHNNGSYNSESAQIIEGGGSKTSPPQTPELRDKEGCSDQRSPACISKDGDDQRSHACISEDGDKSDITPGQTESSSNDHDRLSERKEAVESETNATTEAEGGRLAGKDSRTHWLSSGLAGLTSLISEKKREFRSRDKWSCDAKEIAGGNSCGLKGNQGHGSCKGRSATGGQSSQSLLEILSPLQEEEGSKRTCCVVDVKDGLEETLIRKYDQKHWLNHAGDVLPQRCYLLRVDFKGLSQGAADKDYKTRQEHSALGLVSGSPQDLLEFRPPPVMPQGNVGTPTHHFRKLIQNCQMPGTLIKKLGLEFPRGRGKRRFGQVPFDYGTSVATSQEDSEGQRETDIAFTATGHLIPSSADFEEQQKRRRRKEKKKGKLPKGPRMELEKEGEDGAEVEEWERYEPFHEDVTSQERIKERRYEEELEVVWEKGGPGLVFYTDAQFWRAQQGDFDEQTADEWDVDMSVYYEEGAGDKDARDGVEMINSDKMRAGSLAPSVFTRRKEEETSNRGKKGSRRRKIGPMLPPTIGKFEAHTRGFGRRMMEAQGWQEGQGLGVGSAGMPYALEGDGQHPHDRKGFGYHGEKLQGWASTPLSSSSSSSSTRKPPHRHHRISTIFDRPEEADPPAPSLRTPEPTTLTHRPR